MLTSLLKRVIGGRTAGGDSRSAPAVPARAERLSSALAAQSRGDSRAAEAIYLELIQERPDDADALHLLGHLYRIQKRHADAADLLARAAGARPAAAEIHFELGLACSDLSDIESAVHAYERALELQPDFAAALNNLASVNKARGDPDAVERCYRRLLELDPAFAIGDSELGNALLAQGRVDEAIAGFRAALLIDPACVAAHTNLLYALNFHAGYTPREIFDEHRAWAWRFAEPL